MSPVKDSIDVVLIGCGIQSMHHINCYTRLMKKIPVRFAGLIDPNDTHLDSCLSLLKRNNIDISSTVSSRSIDELAQAIDLSRCVVDIVTPNHLHYPSAEAAVKNGAKKLIIEKPLTHTLKEAKKFLALDGTICILENYLFSSVTRSVIDILSAEKLKPTFVKTEFSKDRRGDSSRGRGISDTYVPHVFSIELPHQLAIVNSLLGEPVEVCDAWHHDMILPDGRIADHGEGAITLLHGNRIPSYNFSCLQGFRHTSVPYRSIRVYCENAVKIFGHYPITMDLDGSLFMYKGMKMLHKQKIKDDSLTNSLEYTLTSFSEGTLPVNRVEFGVGIMSVIEQSIKMAMEYR